MAILNQKPSTPSIRNRWGSIYPDSASSLECIKLGGVDQWIMIRGRSKKNPLLLFLHGGPGAAQIAFARPYQSELEKHFLVVNWDQRGSGKSYSEDIDRNSMCIEQLVSDAYDLAFMLARRFDQEKVYLVGHSWGSVLGMYTIQSYPGLFHAYAGLGQVVDIKETTGILYTYNYEKAQKANNLKALEELEKVRDPYEGATMEIVLSQIKWLEKFGGVYGKTGLKKEIYKNVLLSTEYTLQEKLRYFKASSFCFECLFNELMKVNLFEQVPEVKVPVYFCAGCHDYNTPFTLVEKYYEKLKAPKKQFVWFKKSGHAPNFEEPEKFSRFMITNVLGKTWAGAPQRKTPCPSPG